MNPVDNNNQIPIPTEPDVMNQIVNHITPFIDNPQLPVILQALLHVGNDPKPHSPLPNRGSWTQQEDEYLKNAISQVGTKKWSDVARFVPSRTSKQCRERWNNRLNPELKHGPFEQWEDQIIIEKQREIGNRWSCIAQSLPGRSPGTVKNRWYSGLKNSVSNGSSAAIVTNSYVPTGMNCDPSGGIGVTLDPNYQC